jgi:hypothetical protein
MAQLDQRSRELTGPVVRYTLSAQELAERYPTRATTAGARTAEWRDNRRRNRALGLDRFGRPLPRILGTNPRANDEALRNELRSGLHS